MEKIQSHAVTLTLIRQCPMSNSSEEFPYPIIYLNFKILDRLFFELSCLHTQTRQTDTQKHKQAHGDEYSILAVYTARYNKTKPSSRSLQEVFNY